MRIRVTPPFNRVAKKLHIQDKKFLDDAVRIIVANPHIGKANKGDLFNILVYKFKMGKQECLLAYSVSPDEIILLSLDSHENSYRDLKR